MIFFVIIIGLIYYNIIFMVQIVVKSMLKVISFNDVYYEPWGALHIIGCISYNNLKVSLILNQF